MNPIYQFQMSIVYNGATVLSIPVTPLYKDDLAIDYEMESKQRFYRAKLNGKLIFCSEDFDIINQANFESQFLLNILISWDAGVTWSRYWSGEFYKTDGTFNADNKTFEVSVSPKDNYEDVLAGLDKEYNLIELNPEIQPINIAKRPCIQFYIPGAEVVTCRVSSTYWEQECDAVLDEYKLQNTYYFSLSGSQRAISVSNCVIPEANGVYNGAVPDTWNFEYRRQVGSTEFVVTSQELSQTPLTALIVLCDNSSGKTWSKTYISANPQVPVSLTLEPNAASGATGNVNIYIYDIKVYARVIANRNKPGSYELPFDDMVKDNRNYRRVIPWDASSEILFSSETTTTPTKWGIKQPGEYYKAPVIPPSMGDFPVIPICKNYWGDLSIWYVPYETASGLDIKWSDHYTSPSVNPINSVIEVLLNKIAPGITHKATTEYSQFLYGAANPVSFDKWYLYITQKSNILAGNYSQAAQKAPVTLGKVLDMLKNCFDCYWYIEDNKFKVEHITWFKNGGTYEFWRDPQISLDLTKAFITRNNKALTFETKEYSFDKPDMPSAYKYSWMDEVTEPFIGPKVEIVSKFVKQDNTEEIRVDDFTSDVDYMIINPADCSQDGFAVIAAVDYVDLQRINYSKEQNTLVTPNYPVIDNKLVFLFRDFSGHNNRIQFEFYISGGQVSYITRTADYYEQTIDVPAGTTSIRIAFWNDGEIATDEYLSFVGYVKGLVRKVPFVELNESTILQNGYMAFKDLLYKYLLQDMPSYKLKIDDELVDEYVVDVQRNMKHNIKFPVQTQEDPDPVKFIKTSLGLGQVDKLSINLQNRLANASLAYKTYERDS